MAEGGQERPVLGSISRQFMEHQPQHQRRARSDEQAGTRELEPGRLVFVQVECAMHHGRDAGTFGMAREQHVVRLAEGNQPGREGFLSDRQTGRVA